MKITKNVVLEKKQEVYALVHENSEEVLHNNS